MLKRIMIVGVLSASIVLTCLSTAMPARAASGFANRSAKTEVALVSTESGDVHLSSAHKAHPRDKVHVNLVIPPPKHHHKKIKWTPRRQAIFQIKHDYRKQHGWLVVEQFKYLNLLWNRESDWHKNALNPYSGAYGIAQALGHGNSETADCGHNAYGGLNLTAEEARRANCGTSAFQIKWGLRYILDVYGSPKKAWDHEEAYNWYITAVHKAMIKFNGKMVVKMAEHIGLKKYTGSVCWYEWGGTGPCSSGFDCSGLVYRTSINLGQANIPRTANDIMHWVALVRKPIPGDLIFYGSGNYASHVAIYVGHGRAIEALDSSNPVGFWSVTWPGKPIAYGRISYTWNPRTKF